MKDISRRLFFKAGIRVGSTAPPSDSDIASSSFAVYEDNTAGNPQIKARIKDSAGTATTLNLSPGTSYLGTIDHGSTAGTTRPLGFGVVLWRGTVRPTNAVEGDLFLYVSPSTAPAATTSLWRVISTAVSTFVHIAGGPVGTGNQDSDPSLELSIDNTWNSFLTLSGIAYSTDFARTGTKSLKLTKTSSAGNALVFQNNSVNNIDVRPGEGVVATAWFRPGSTARVVSISVQFIAAKTDALLSAIEQWTGDSVTEVSGAWVQVRAAGIAPAGSVYARIVYNIDNAGANEIHYLDDTRTELGLIASAGDDATILGGSTSPGDANIETGQAGLYVDTTATAPLIMARVKDAAGTGFYQVLSNPNTKFKSADETVSSTSFANDTHLQFPVIANAIYGIEGYLYVWAAAATTGVKIAINGPASFGALRFASIGQITQGGSGAASTFYGNAVTAYDAATMLGASVVSNTSNTAPSQVLLNGYFRNGANAGTLALRIAGEAAAAITYMEGSWMRLTRLL